MQRPIRLFSALAPHEQIVQNAIQKFELPDGWEKVSTPRTKSSNRSPMWSFGVKARRSEARPGQSGKNYAFFLSGFRLLSTAIIRHSCDKLQRSEAHPGLPFRYCTTAWPLPTEEVVQIFQVYRSFLVLVILAPDIAQLERFMAVCVES